MCLYLMRNAVKSGKISEEEAEYYLNVIYSTREKEKELEEESEKLLHAFEEVLKSLMYQKLDRYMSEIKQAYEQLEKKL